MGYLKAARAISLTSAALCLLLGFGAGLAENEDWAVFWVFAGVHLGVALLCHLGLARK